MIYKIVMILLFILGVFIAYILGKTSEMKNLGQIIISDPDSGDDEHFGKVQFIFEDEIEELLRYKYAVMEIKNELTIKYNHDNEDTKK